MLVIILCLKVNEKILIFVFIFVLSVFSIKEKDIKGIKFMNMLIIKCELFCILFNFWFICFNFF